MSSQKTFHLLMVVMTRHNDHRTRGQLMGLTNSTSLDDLIKCTRPPCQDTDEHKRAINKNIQYLGQLPNNWQTIGTSLKPIFMSPKALQKGH